MDDRDELRQFIESRDGRTPTEEELDAIIQSDSEGRTWSARKHMIKPAWKGLHDQEAAQERDPNLRAEDHGESPSRPSWWRWIFRGGS